MLGSSFNLRETFENGSNYLGTSFSKGMDWQHWAGNYLEAAQEAYGASRQNSVGRCVSKRHRHGWLQVIPGRKMMAEEESSLLKFEELLAQSFMNWNPMCVYVKQRLAVQFDARSGLEAATSQPIHPKSHCHSCLTCHAHSWSKQT